jgi:FAD:protein FMN transferase
MSALNYFEFRAMGTQIMLAAEGSLEQVEKGFRQVQTFIEAEEKRFTRFSEESELSALNRANGSWCEVSPELFEVVALSQDLHERTHGLFDPSVLEALEWAGYDRTLEELRRYGAAAEIQILTPPRTSSLASIRLDRENQRVRLPYGMRIDLGGIAKGWIAERATEKLACWSKACSVDAGGDVYMAGMPSGEDFWQVALEDPRDSLRTLAVLKLPPGAVATSSVTKRRWKQAGQDRHHLIDPRTQMPASSDWLSVTAIAETLPEAEVFAKALLIGGSHESSWVSAQNNGVEFIAVDVNGKLWGSKNSREFIND